MTKETIEPITAKERAEILYNKYSREYNRILERSSKRIR